MLKEIEERDKYAAQYKSIQVTIYSSRHMKTKKLSEENEEMRTKSKEIFTVL